MYTINEGDKVLGAGPTQAAAIEDVLAKHGAMFDVPYAFDLSRQACLENLLANGDLALLHNGNEVEYTD